MSNIYLEYYEESIEHYGIDGISSPDTGIVILALVKELQTLNETLNKVLYRNNEGDWFINTEARPSYED